MNAIGTDAGYRFDHPTVAMVLRDMRIPDSDPGPGDTIPAFRITTTDGIEIDNDSLRRDGRPALIVFGSLTCPVTESAGDGLRELATRYGDRVRFIMVNVRGHIRARRPRNLRPSIRRPNTRHTQGAPPVAVRGRPDDLDGTLHRAFGPRPSSAYLVDSAGRITFRAHWSNITPAIEEAVAARGSRSTTTPR